MPRPRHVWVIELEDGTVVSVFTIRRRARALLRRHKEPVLDIAVRGARIVKYIPEKLNG